MRNSRNVDLIMKLHPYRRKKEDSPSPHRQYYVRNVDFMFDVDFAELTSGRLKGIDSLRSSGVNFFYKDKVCSYVRRSSATIII